MKKFPIVEVDWIDPATTHGWRNHPEQAEAVLCRIVGYLTHESPKFLHITQSISEDDTYDETTVIPKGVITRKHTVRR